MPADLLVLKSRGKKKNIKITQKMRAGYCPDNHSIVVNLKDFKDLALFLHDLEDLYNAPVKKAIAEYESGRVKVWPF